MLVCVGAESVGNCSSLEKFLASNIDLEASRQIDVTWFEVGINLDHADILRWTFIKINMKLFIKIVNNFSLFRTILNIYDVCYRENI